MSENGNTPTEELKSLYHEAAKRVHPDRSASDSDRSVREGLMIEANLAYEAGDEEALRRILAETEASAETGFRVEDGALESADAFCNDAEPIFQSWSQPEAIREVRIPHLGHLILLSAIAGMGFLFASVLMLIAVRFHAYGVYSATKAATDVHYILGEEAAIYLFTLVLSVAIFPLFWNKSFLAGLQWNGTTAMHLRGRLFGAAVVCFVLALVNGILLPGPEDTPIDKIFRTPGAAWLLFGFGVAVAPFFEEVLFRGFILPALCTVCDWIGEQVTGRRPRRLFDNGHPRWSLPARVIASVLTSLPFALMHGEQTGHAFGPFLLLIGVSLVLCWTRLSTRSLAASTLVHASYNFLLFSLMLLGTGGFQHMDKM
jgi:hypothetical protein